MAQGMTRDRWIALRRLVSRMPEYPKGISTTELAMLASHTRAQTRSRMQELAILGYVIHKGLTRQARWYRVQNTQMPIEFPGRDHTPAKMAAKKVEKPKDLIADDRVIEGDVQLGAVLKPEAGDGETVAKKTSATPTPPAAPPAAKKVTTPTATPIPTPISAPISAPTPTATPIPTPISAPTAAPVGATSADRLLDAAEKKAAEKPPTATPPTPLNDDCDDIDAEPPVTSDLNWKRALVAQLQQRLSETPSPLERASLQHRVAHEQAQILVLEHSSGGATTTTTTMTTTTMTTTTTSVHPPPLPTQTPLPAAPAPTAPELVAAQPITDAETATIIPAARAAGYFRRLAREAVLAVAKSGKGTGTERHAAAVAAVAKQMLSEQVWPEPYDQMMAEIVDGPEVRLVLGPIVRHAYNVLRDEGHLEAEIYEDLCD